MVDHNFPKAFICHATEDKKEALELATALLNNGIDGWVDNWEIMPGDSLRQKIESSINETNYFIVLLSKNSVDKPWVKQEIDAAFVKKLEGQVRIIPVIFDLTKEEIPLFMRTLRYIKFDAEDYIEEIINTCSGISKKPQIKKSARVLYANELGLSPSAFEIACEINKKYNNGFFYGSTISIEDMAKLTNQSIENAILAATELEDVGYIKYLRVMGGYGSIAPERKLFVKTDNAVYGFDPEKDVMALIAAMINDGSSQFTGQKLSEILDWPPHRINSALSILIDEKHILASRDMGSAPYIAHSVIITEKTKLFARRFA